MIGPSVCADCPRVTAPAVKIAPWKYDPWLSVTPLPAMSMNIEVAGVHELKSHDPDEYAELSVFVFQPQNTPVLVIETVPETYIVIIPPSPSVPSEPEGWAPPALTPRYLTTPSIDTLPSMKTVPRICRMRVDAFQSSSPMTEPLALVVWQV